MKKQTKIWKCKDGTKIRIRDMESSHLLNTIKMLKRATYIRHKESIKLGEQMLCILQSEMAIMSVENDLNNMYENEPDPLDYFPIYENLINEAAKRNLTI